MWELRWVLLALGVLLIGVVYLWGRGVFRRAREPDSVAAKQHASEIDPAHQDPGKPAREPSAPPRKQKAAQAPDRIITVRFIPKASELNCEDVVLALRKAGLQHGRYGIFHCMDERDRDESLFSVANLTEPGSFDLANLTEQTIPGMSFFMVLPGSGDPVARFDLMVQTARSLAHDLDAELHDEKGSSWSIQRERYVREEIIRYRHQLERL